MKHKKLVVALALAMVLAIAGGAIAFAAFSSKASTGPDNLTTGTNGLGLSATTWDLSKLLPAVDTNSYDSTYARSTNVAITNTSDYDFASTILTDSLTSNPGDVGSLLHVAIFDPYSAATPFAAYTVDQLNAGSVNLGVLDHTGANTATIKLTVWLDSSTGNDYSSLVGPGLSFTFTGNQ